MVDIDHFKLINDRYGHDGGDAVLRHFAELARHELQASCEPPTTGPPPFTLARYGGEEFVVVLRDVDERQARAHVERLRSRVQAHAFPNTAEAVTLSAGVAAYRPGDTLDALLKRADRRLYEAKDSGRNRVLAASLPIRGILAAQTI